MSKTIKIKYSEAQVKEACCQYMEARRYHWWPTNNTGIYDPKKRAFLLSKTRKMGVPDANLLHNGTYYAIEFKSTKGVQSEHQREFQKKTEAAGGVYLLVRDLKDLERAGI